jgi:hypothetical protein
MLHGRYRYQVSHKCSSSPSLHICPLNNMPFHTEWCSVPSPLMLQHLVSLCRDCIQRNLERTDRLLWTPSISSADSKFGKLHVQEGCTGPKEAVMQMCNGASKLKNLPATTCLCGSSLTHCTEPVGLSLGCLIKTAATAEETGSPLNSWYSIFINGLYKVWHIWSLEERMDFHSFMPVVIWRDSEDVLWVVLCNCIYTQAALEFLAGNSVMGFCSQKVNKVDPSMYCASLYLEFGHTTLVIMSPDVITYMFHIIQISIKCFYYIIRLHWNISCCSLQVQRVRSIIHHEQLYFCSQNWAKC